MVEQDWPCLCLASAQTAGLCPSIGDVFRLDGNIHGMRSKDQLFGIKQQKTAKKRRGVSFA
jgi:hypothetical protein